jgi:hypothetical protein
MEGPEPQTFVEAMGTGEAVGVDADQGVIEPGLSKVGA